MDAGIWTQILTVIAMEIQIPAFAAVISDGYHVSKLPETTIMNRIMSFGVTRVYFITLNCKCKLNKTLTHNNSQLA